MTPRIPEWTFGDRLRKARREAGLSQQEVAERIGVPLGRYSGWETGEFSPRSADLVDVAKKVSAITDVPTEWLLGLEG